MASRGYKRVYIGTGGIFTIIALFLVLQNAGLEFIDLSGNFSCEGTEENPCVSYFDIKNPTSKSVYIYNRDELKLDFSPEIDEYQLYVKYYGKWVPMDFTMETRLNNVPDDRKYVFVFPRYSTKHFKLEGIKHKPEDKIKWGAYHSLAELDPIWDTVSTAPVLRQEDKVNEMPLKNFDLIITNQTYLGEHINITVEKLDMTKFRIRLKANDDFKKDIETVVQRKDKKGDRALSTITRSKELRDFKSKYTELETNKEFTKSISKVTNTELGYQLANMNKYPLKSKTKDIKFSKEEFDLTKEEETFEIEAYNIGAKFEIGYGTITGEIVEAATDPFGVCTALNSSGDIGISFINFNTNVRYCKKVSGSWSCATVPSTSIGSGDTCDLEFDNNVTPITVNFRGPTASDLRFCNNESAGWACIEPNNTASTNSVSLGIDTSSNVHIASYKTVVPTGVNYFTNSSGAWQWEIVENATGYGSCSKLILNSTGGIHIFHGDTSSDATRHCYGSFGSWTCSEIDSRGKTVNGVIANNDTFHLLMVDDPSSDLYYITDQTGSWVTTLIKSGTFAEDTDNRENSIVIDSNGGVHIVINDDSAGGLWYFNNLDGWDGVKLLDDQPIGVSLSNEIGTKPAAQKDDTIHLAYSTGTGNDVYYAQLNSEGLFFTSGDITPTQPYASNDLLFNATCSLLNSGTLRAYVQVYNGSTAYGSVQETTIITNGVSKLIYNLSSTNTNLGENWTGEFWCGILGGINTSKTNTTVEIINAFPTVPTELLCDGNSSCNDSFSNLVDLQCNGSTDADGDTITYVVSLGNESFLPEYRVFDDEFVEETTTDLADHTPDIGTSWSLDSFTSFSSIDVIGGTGYAQFPGDGNDYLIYTADDQPTTSTYNVTFTTSQADSIDDVALVFARYHNDSDNYFVSLSNTASECKLSKVVGGTRTVLMTAATGFADTDTIVFAVSDTEKVIYKNGVKWLNSTDNSITGIGKAALGCGDYKGDANEDCSADWKITDFTVNDSVTYNVSVFEYIEIGNHTQGNPFSWDSTSYIGEVFERGRCKATDLVATPTIFTNNYTQTTYINVTFGNEPPTTPTNLTCDSGSCNGTFSGTVDMNCSGSTDSEGDAINYSIEKGNQTPIAAFCDGTASSCTTWTNETSCNWDSGCSWSNSTPTDPTNKACGNDCSGGDYTYPSTASCTNYVLADSCAGASSCDGTDTVVDISLNGTSFAFGDTVGVEWQVMCYGTSDDVGLYYYNGSSWTTILLDANCDYGAATGNYTDSFVITSSSSTQYVRAITSYGSQSSSCFTGSYGDVDDINFTVVAGGGGCTGTADDCGTYNASQINCERVNCDWNPASFTTNYYSLGIHTETTVYEWDTTTETNGVNYTSFRCRARDNGSLLYSSYFTLPSNFTINNAGGDTCDCSSIQAGNQIDCSENCDIGVCDFGGESLNTTNIGEITVSGLLTNIGELIINTVGCNITLDSGISLTWS